MKFEFKNKIYTVDDRWLASTMAKLDLTKAEALDMWLCDHDIDTTPEQDELTEKANKIRRYERSAVENKKTTRKRNKDAIKMMIIHDIAEKLQENAKIRSVVVRNDEKYVDFVVNGEEFTLNLTKHRKK